MEDLFNEQNNNEESFDFNKYTEALKRRWWVVAAVTLLVTIPWLFYIKKQPPVYQSEALIAFETVGGPASNNLVQSRILRLKSRGFADRVTADLGLTMELLREEDDLYLSRFDLFENFSTTYTPQVGQYRITYYPTGYCALYHENLRLDSLRFEQLVDTTVVYNGLKFALKPEAFSERREIKFVVNDFRGTVSSLRAREQVNFNGRGDVMTISLKDKNPLLASKTVNMLAQMFIGYSVEMSQEKINERLNYLRSKLNLAAEDLDKVERRMKTFSYDHPMGLNEETMATMTELRKLELDSTNANIQKNDLINFLNKFDYTRDDFQSDQQGHYIYRQIASMEIFNNDLEMDMARKKLRDYDEVKKNLQQDRGFPDAHDQVIEISRKISDVELHIIELAKNKLIELQETLADIKNKMKEKQEMLVKLPTEQVKWITLERQHSVKGDVYRNMLAQVDEAELASVVGAENATIIDKAVPNLQPVSADKKKKAAAGGAAGLAIGIMFVLVMELFDKRIKTRNDVKRYLQLPILGVIPKVKFDDYELQDSEKAKSISSQIVTHDYSPTPVGEAYRSLRTSLLFNKSIGEIKTLAIGSVAPGEGKSFTAANLGITLAQQKSKTLLIDADLRRGVLHNSFNVPKKPGLTNYLTGVVPLDTILHETYIPNLTMITCGSLLPNPSELLGSDRMTRFIEGVKQRFDFIIFDTPPLMAASDAVILSTLVDGVVVLVRSGMTNRNHVAQKLELFNNLQTNVLGALLNCAGAEIAHDGYSYYRY